MRISVVCAAAALLALSVPIASASAAPARPAGLQLGAPVLVQADWDGRPGWHHDWHHHWRHEWRDHWHPEWHHHWHHGYGYQY